MLRRLARPSTKVRLHTGVNARKSSSGHCRSPITSPVDSGIAENRTKISFRPLASVWSTPSTALTLNNGADFLAFAVPTMMGEVRRHFRDYGWAVKVPRRLKDLQGQMVKARGALSQETRARADCDGDRQTSRHRP